MRRRYQERVPSHDVDAVVLQAALDAGYRRRGRGALDLPVDFRPEFVVEVAVGQGEVDHRRDAVGVPAHLHSREHLVQTGLEPRGHRVGALVQRLGGDQFQAGRSRHRRQRIAVECPRVVDPLGVVPFGIAALGDHIHDVSLAAYCPAGQGASHDLRHGRQIGRDAIAHLRSAGGGAESGDNLIENQHHAMLVAQLAQARQVLRRVEGKLPVVSAGGFQDDGRDVAVAFHGLLHRVQVSGRNDNHAAP